MTKVNYRKTAVEALAKLSSLQQKGNKEMDTLKIMEALNYFGITARIGTLFQTTVFGLIPELAIPLDQFLEGSIISAKLTKLSIEVRQLVKNNEPEDLARATNLRIEMLRLNKQIEELAEFNRYLENTNFILPTPIQVLDKYEEYLDTVLYESTNEDSMANVIAMYSTEANRAEVLGRLTKIHDDYLKIIAYMEDDLGTPKDDSPFIGVHKRFKRVQESMELHRDICKVMDEVGA